MMAAPKRRTIKSHPPRGYRMVLRAGSRAPYPASHHPCLIRNASGASTHRLRVPSGHAQPPRRGDESLSPPARRQPGRVVSVGARGPRPGQAPRPADLPEHRLRGLPLVSRDGTRVVRARADGALPQRPLRVDQGRPRGAARSRPGLHGRRPGDDRGRRLADVGVPDARRPPVLRRDLLPRRAAARDALVPPGPRRRRARLARAARRGRGGRWPARPGPGRSRRGSRPATTTRRPTLLDRATAGHRGLVRRRERRLGPGAEVPAADDHRVPAPPPPRDRRPAAAGGRPALARRDGRRRAARPARWRLPSLLDRRPLARAAFRADALRQRPARAGLRARLGAHRRRALSRGRDRDARLHAPRAHDRRTARSPPARTPTPTGSRA